MGRNRVYDTPADRQRAYRERQAGQPGNPLPPPSRRPLSRPKRLTVVIHEVESLAAEYEGWRDRLPESLIGSGQDDELSEAIDLLREAAEMLSQLQPPLGFGRVR